jgi:hypothetical protein
MKLRALIVVLLTAAAAHAGWTTLTIAGNPRDVELGNPDAGEFVVTADTQAVQYQCPFGGSCVAGTTLLPAGANTLYTAALNSGSCLFGVDSLENLSGGSACNYIGTFPNGGTAMRMRCESGGACGFLGHSAANYRYYFAAAPSGYPGNWVTTGITGAGPPGTFSIVDIAGVKYSLVSVGATRATLIVDAGTLFPVTTPIALPVDSSLFVRANGALGMFVVLQGQPELFGTDVTIAGGVADAGFSPTGLVVDPALNQLGLIRYSEAFSSPYGVGFGIATPRDGGALLAGALPDPAAPGTQWVSRNLIANDGGIIAIECADPRFCVAISAATTNNVFVYRNDFSAVPTTFNAPPIVLEGATQPAGATPADQDGDPLFFTWEDDGGAIAVTVDPDAGANHGTATLFGRGVDGGACISMWDVSFVASDGYAPHDTRSVKSVLFRRASADAPVISPASPMPVVVGRDGPITFTASPGGACAGSSMIWSLVAPDSGTLTVVGDGGSAIYTPPTYFCGGSGDKLEAQAVYGGSSPPIDVPISLVPWGVPYAPQFVMPVATTQLAGTSAAYLIDRRNHFCGQAAGFPLLDVLIVDGGMLPANVQLSVDGGLLIVDSPNGCASGPISVQVETEVDGEAYGRVSVPATFNLSLLMNAPPLQAPYPFSIAETSSDGAGNVSGTFGLSVPCIPPGVTANVTVVEKNLSTMPVSLPAAGGWTINGVPGSCGGGTFHVQGNLFVDGGLVAMSTPPIPFTVAPQGAPGVGAFSPKTIDLSCNTLDATLHVDDSDGGCALSNSIVTWSQTGGAPVTLQQVDNHNAHITSTQPGLSLAGQSATFSVLADDGRGNTATGGGTVSFEAHFIGFRHSMAPAATNADALTTVQITVVNTQPCPAGNVMVHESLNGLEYVPGSSTMPMTAAGAGLDIGPLALDAGGQFSVSYLARVPLLGSAQPTATATINGVDVTATLPAPKPPDSCGCSSSSSLLLLAALSLWPRRRALWRRRTSRHTA